MVNFFFANFLAVKKQLYLGCIGSYPNVYILSLVEIPVGENVNKGRFFIVCPFSTENECAVLGESGGIVLSEIAVLGGIGGRLADIVEACPDELSRAEFRVTVSDNAVFGIFRAPACGTVYKR